MRLSSGPYPPRPSWPIENTTELIDLERVAGRWLLDTTHLCMWDVPQARKCIMPEDLKRRFSKLNQISDGNVWATTPDEVVDYLLTTRNMHPRIESTTDTGVTIRVDGEWPVGIVSNELTVSISGIDGSISGAKVIAGDGSPPGVARTTVEVESANIVRGSRNDWTVTAPVAPDVAIELDIS